MTHLLDNPAWNALNTGNRNLSSGNEQVKLFPEDVAPFAGLKEFSHSNFNLLYDLLPATRSVAIVTATDIEIPDNWKIVYNTKLFQMVCNNQERFSVNTDKLVALQNSNVPAMLALTALTNPGPFYNNTIRFGNYSGIFDDNKLVALTGFRLSVGKFKELSAVCTHPGYLGKGYASTLIKHTANTILDLGCTPFLHVKTDNTNAIKLYNHLGFFTRSEMIFNIIQKK